MKRIGLVMIMGVMVLSCQREEGSKPRLYSPMERMAVVHPTFVWESVGDMYHLQVSSDSSFASTVINEEELTDTTYTPEDTLEEARYYWRVRASLDTWGEWSDVSSFFVVGPGWGLISPPDADTVKFPILIWSTTDDADGYHLFIYRGDTAAGRLVLDTNLTDTSYTITDTLDPATYRWGINALIGDEEIPYPEVRRFVTYTLDETYFPVGPDYMWEYEGSYQESWWPSDGSGDTSYTYFYSVEVKKFVPQAETLYVDLNQEVGFVGNEFVYKNDTIRFTLWDAPATLHLFPKDGDQVGGPDSPSAMKISDSTFCFGYDWGEGTWWDGWEYVYFQRGKGIYLYRTGEYFNWHNPTEENPNGGWSRTEELINLDKGE